MISYDTRRSVHVYPPGGPTVVRIKLGGSLRQHREAAGLTRAEAGRAIRASESKISRLELGRVGLKKRDVDDLLVLYEVAEDERERLLGLISAAGEPGWWRRFGDVLPDWFELYIGLEEAASSIRGYEVQFVPGLLQTQGYAQAAMSLGEASPMSEEVERKVALRMARQRVLTGADAPTLWAVVDEAVLRRAIGGPQVFREQILYLLDVTAVENITLQVVPFDRGGHSGAGGPFTILRFSEPEVPDVVYLEQLSSALYLEKRDDIDGYMEVMDRLSVEALSPPDSRRFIEGVLKEL